MTGFIDILSTYYYSLIHPFKTFENIDNNPRKPYLSLFESLSVSWLMVIFNALIRLIFINFVLQTFVTVSEGDTSFLGELIGKTGFSGHYIIILSVVWDIFLFPIITFITLQLWIFLFKFFGNAMNVEGDIDQKSHDIVSVSLSSYGLYAIPFLGDMIQKLSQYFLMFIGLKKEFKIRPLEAGLILMTPLLLVIALSMIFTLLMVLIFN